VERSKLGKEVAEMFKNALEPEAFALFKRCKLCPSCSYRLLN
jgi:hypothetical protein